MLRRSIGENGPEVSQVTYGTMRLREEVDGLKAADLLCELHDAGIDTHHSSHEYETHAVYLKALATAKATGREFKHIVKLSEPSFDESVFNKSKLQDLIDRELFTLGADQLTSVQWLLRTPDALDTEGRLKVLHEQAEDIRQTFEDLLSSGKIANVSVFPYSIEFGNAALTVVPTPTLCTYLNLFELEYLELLNDSKSRPTQENQACSLIAIRPFGGDPSRLLTGPIADALMAHGHHPAQAALQFPLFHPNVSTIIVSANSADHRTTLIELAGSTSSDKAAFETFRAIAETR